MMLIATDKSFPKFNLQKELRKHQNSLQHPIVGVQLPPASLRRPIVSLQLPPASSEYPIVSLQLLPAVQSTQL